MVHSHNEIPHSHDKEWTKAIDDKMVEHQKQYWWKEAKCKII